MLKIKIMAKDYTKYNIEGIGTNLSKAKLIQNIGEHNAGSFEGTINL